MNRVVFGLPPEQYHAHTSLSNSGLGDIAQSPAHYYARHLNPKRPAQEAKSGQLEGSLLHTLLLEPQEFTARYIIGPTMNRNKTEWKEFVKAHPGRIHIQGEQYEVATAQAEACLALPEVAEAFKKGHREVSAFWIDPVTGVECRCRPDFVHEAGSGVVLLDAKTYSNASPKEFARQIARKNYHRQDTWYSDGYRIASERDVLAFIFVAVEADYPYGACAIMIDDEGRQEGRRQYRRLTNTYAECLKNNRWPSYSSAIELVSLPLYALEGA